MASTIHRSLQDNVQAFQQVFQNCSDIVFHEVLLPNQAKGMLIYVDGLIDAKLVISGVLMPNLQVTGTQNRACPNIQDVLKESYPVLQTKTTSDFKQITDQILKGYLAVLADGEAEALLVDAKQFDKRAIEEPDNETTLRGPRESFTENLRTNTTLLRRICASPQLKIEALKIGTVTRTDLALIYLDGIVEQPVLNEVRKRVSRIELKGILESGYIEEAIEDRRFSLFPQMLNTERPDVTIAALLEGKVAILTSGTPFALITPATFWSGLQAPDDYYERFLFVSYSRIIRYTFLLLTMFSSSLYVALTNYHPEMIPAKLMMSIVSLRENAPFPTVIEVIMMEFMFEGLREAGIRLPKTIGPLVTIVGALIVGDAAVRAGLISAPIVIVVSVSGMGSYIIPRYRFAYPLRMIRFPMLVLSGAFGLYGLAVGMAMLLIHLINLKPYGAPYLSPVTPMKGNKLKDVLLRWPKTPPAAGRNPKNR